MVKINVKVENEDVGIQIFDELYAYRQSLNEDYTSDWEITFNESSADLNILYASMPDADINSEGYDIIIFSNGDEPLSVLTETMVEYKDKNNVYFLINGYLTEDHNVYNTVIWHSSDLMLARDLWTRGFYPYFYQNIEKFSMNRSPTIGAINGANRTVRAYFFDNLIKTTNIKPRESIIDQRVINTNISLIESSEDTSFRLYLEQKYANMISQEAQETHYDHIYNMPSLGINGKFGEIQIGYYFTDEFFVDSCIIFPETSWQNNELALTEKAMKCFYAGSLPFPVGGAFTNQLYNKLGFKTSWNLLPKKYQEFDSIINHRTRIKKQVQAVEWLQENNDIFLSDQFVEMTRSNRDNMLLCKPDVISIKQINNIIEKYI